MMESVTVPRSTERCAETVKTDNRLRINNTNLSFNDLYKELKEKTEKYTGDRNLLEDEDLMIPYINIDTNIEYDELCNKEIRNAEGLYIANAIQNVTFTLNETGGNLISEGTIKDQYQSLSTNTRSFHYTKPFVLFLKEADKEKPYFALKVNNTEVLVESNYLQ